MVLSKRLDVSDQKDDGLGEAGIEGVREAFRDLRRPAAGAGAALAPIGNRHGASAASAARPITKG